MGDLGDPRHPLWSLLRLVILMATLAFVLWVNATKFDETEIQTIIWVFLAAAGVEGGVQAVQRMSPDRPRRQIDIDDE